RHRATGTGAQITGGIRPSILNLYVGLRREAHSSGRAGSGHGALPSSRLGCPPSASAEPVLEESQPAKERCLMKSILACVTAFLLAAVVDDRYLGARAAADTVPAPLTGPPLQDEWRNRS